MARLLITGCDGFVGCVLTSMALEEGHDVWGVDRLDNPAFAGARHLVADLTDPRSVRNVVDEARPDAIVHLAAQASVGASFDDPAGTLVNNTAPVLNLLEWLRKTGSPCRLLAIGSADEYGPVASPDRLPLREDSPVNPVSPYALAKSVQNQYCRAYSGLYGADVVVTRSFNHTGAGQRDAFAVPAFARQLVRIKLRASDPVLETGNLEVRRDFLDVRDVCRAYLALLSGGRAGETYNVCSGRSHRLRELVDMMAKITGVDVTIRVDPARLRPTDTPELRGDRAKITRDVGWDPKISIEQTLRAVIDFWIEAERIAE